MARFAVYRWGRPLELYQLQRGVRQRPGMDGGLSADQRAHPGGVLELDARSDGDSLLSRRRMERREHHRQLEQCGYDRMRRWSGKTGGRNISLSTRSDRLDRIRPRNTP